MRKRHFKTQYRLSKAADMIEHYMVHRIIKFFAWGIERFLIDLAFGKSRYRKRGPKMRPIIYKTIIIHQPVPRLVRLNDMNRRGYGHVH